ncbi:MAG: hypothetical protein KF782_25240 [Labilithrix sp.]|nr:hypothetical protein [Labilithrix sp.]
MKHKLTEMTRDAQESAERARKLREHLQEVTAQVDGLVGEARSTLKRAVEFLEREGLRGKKSGAYARVTGVREADPADAEPTPSSTDRARRAREDADGAPRDQDDPDGEPHRE